jgi:membrane protein
MRAVVALFRETATRWADDRCYRLGASLAYYAIFSLFPLLLLSLTVLGYALGEGDSVRTEVLDSLTGATGSPAVRALLDQTLASMQAHRTARGVGAVVGILALVFGASGVFSELSASLNAIWRVREPESRTVWQWVVGFVSDKALSFGLVGAAGLLLLGSLVLSTGLSAISEGAYGHLPRWPIELLASLLFPTVALAAMFRTLPQTRVRWSDVYGGALLVAILLTLLKRLLAWFLAHVGSYAAYGAVGAVLGLLLVIYVSSLVMFFGAEFTRVYAERFGSLRSRAANGHVALGRAG